MRQRTRSLQQYQKRINTRLQAMDQELSSAQPNRKRVEEQARAMEQAMNRWQTQQQKTAAVGRSLFSAISHSNVDVDFLPIHRRRRSTPAIGQAGPIDLDSEPHG